jgi:hypothetical protein
MDFQNPSDRKKLFSKKYSAIRKRKMAYLKITSQKNLAAGYKFCVFCQTVSKFSFLAVCRFPVFYSFINMNMT